MERVIKNDDHFGHTIGRKWSIVKPKEYVDTNPGLFGLDANSGEALYEKAYNKLGTDILHKRRDMGGLLAELGYDAINAEGHGKSGSYVVVLNRTKVILLGDD